MSKYEKFRDLGEKLIKKNGSPAAFYTPQGHVIHGFATGGFGYQSKDVDGTHVQQGDLYLFWHSEEIPTTAMLHRLNNRTYSVVDIMRLTSRDGVTALCKVQLRG